MALSLDNILRKYNFDAEVAGVIFNIADVSNHVDEFKDDMYAEFMLDEEGDNTNWDEMFKDLKDYLSENPYEDEPLEENYQLNESFKSIEKDIDETKPIIVKGVKGMKSKPFIKKFKNYAAFEKWNDSEEADDFEIYQVMNESYPYDNYNTDRVYQASNYNKSLTEDDDFGYMEDEGDAFDFDGDGEKYDLTQDYQADMSTPEKVIVTQPFNDLKVGQVITVLSTTSTHYIYKKGKSEMGVPKGNVQPLISERNIRRGVTLEEKKIAHQYLKYLNRGINHDRICESIAESLDITPNDVETQLNEVFDDESSEFFINVATGRSNKPLPYSLSSQIEDVDDRGYLIKDREEEFGRGYIKYNFDGRRINESDDFSSEEESIADEVFMELIKSSKYKEGYDTLEDAVMAVISVMNLQDELGDEGAYRIIDIIKHKFADEDFEDGGEKDITDEEDFSPVETASESEIGKEITEAVKRNFGAPRSWEKTNTHFIAKFYDKPLVESKIRAIRQQTLTFDKAKEDDYYTLIYFRR